MSEQDNLAVNRQSWDAWNAHDTSAWLKLLSEALAVRIDVEATECIRKKC